MPIKDLSVHVEFPVQLHHVVHEIAKLARGLAKYAVVGLISDPQILLHSARVYEHIHSSEGTLPREGGNDLGMLLPGSFRQPHY